MRRTQEFRFTWERSSPEAALLHSCSSASAAVAAEAGTVTTADLVSLQQQFRQELADAVVQIRNEMRNEVNGRLDLLNSMTTAILNIATASSNGTRPHKISDLIPKNWEGSNEKDDFRNFMSDLHLWMQGRSDQGEKMLCAKPRCRKN